MSTPPVFISTDADAILADAEARFEAASKRPLYPAQYESLALKSTVYRELVCRHGIQLTGESNLVDFATGQGLDEIGKFSKTPRLDSQPATCTATVTRQDATIARTLAAGAFGALAKGTMRFAVDQDWLMPAGVASIDIVLVAEDLGPGGNDLSPGSIVTLDPALEGITITNTSTTAGGAEPEDDDRYRLRLKEAIRSLSVAGPRQAYRALVMAYSPLVADVGVLKIGDGRVGIYPLMTTGLPDVATTTRIHGVLDDDWVVPFTVDVQVYPPTVLDYAIRVRITTLRGADPGRVMRDARLALDAYLKPRAYQLGMDVVRSQIIAALSVPGVYTVQLDFPAEDTVIQDDTWARCSSIDLAHVGVADA